MSRDDFSGRRAGRLGAAAADLDPRALAATERDPTEATDPTGSTQRQDVIVALSPSSEGRPLAARKVAIILSGLGAGGTERVANIMANHWAARGWPVTVVTLDPPGTASYYPFHPRVTIRHLGVPARRRGKLGAAQAILRRVAAIRRVLREEGPDVAIALLTRQSVLTLIAAQGLNLPVVVSERSNPEFQYPGRLWNWLRMRLYPLAFGLVTMTEGARDFFPRALRDRSWIIPNPVMPAGERRPRAGERRLVAAGRLETVKGFDLLLQAFARVAASYPGWKLVVWGEGRERAALEALRDRLGLAHSVEFPGLTRQPGAWVETADAFVLSSRYEGFPNVLLEAMAHGLPAVSFDCRWGPREMIRHGVDGLLARPQDVADLAAMLAAVMRDAGLRSRLAGAARVSAQRYTTEAVMAKWDELIDAAIAARTGSQPRAAERTRY